MFRGQNSHFLRWIFRVETLVVLDWELCGFAQHLQGRWCCYAVYYATTVGLQVTVWLQVKCLVWRLDDESCVPVKQGNFPFAFASRPQCVCSVHTGSSLLGPGHEISTDLRQMTSSTSSVSIHLRGRTDSNIRFYFQRFLSRFIT